MKNKMYKKWFIGQIVRYKTGNTYYKVTDVSNVYIHIETSKPIDSFTDKELLKPITFLGHYALKEMIKGKTVGLFSGGFLEEVSISRCGTKVQWRSGNRTTSIAAFLEGWSDTTFFHVKVTPSRAREAVPKHNWSIEDD